MRKLFYSAHISVSEVAAADRAVGEGFRIVGVDVAVSLIFTGFAANKSHYKMLCMMSPLKIACLMILS